MTLPGLVTAVDERGATVEIGGRRTHAVTRFVPDVRVGAWVLVSAGSVLEVIDRAEAAELESALREAEAIP